MKTRHLAFFLVCFLIFLPFAALATPDGDALREVIETVVRTQTTCIYNIKLKDANAPPVLAVDYSYGNGFFVKSEKPPYLIRTAGHVVVCAQALPEKFFGNSLKREDVASYGISMRTHFRYKSAVYEATAVKILFNGELPDSALLEAALPDGIKVKSLEILENGYDIGSPVMIIGGMPSGSKWVLRIKPAVIEELTESYIRLSTPVYSGLSGSVAVFKKDGRYFAIGIVSSMGLQNDGTPMDTAYVTRLTGSVFELEKTAPK